MLFRSCALALGLAQAGLRVALIGPAPAPSQAKPAWDLRVFALSRASMALFERLKIARRLDWARIAAVRDMQIQGDDTRAPGQLHFSAYGAQVGELAWIVEGRNLQHALELGCEMQASLVAINGEVEAYTVGADTVDITLNKIGRAHV